MTWASENLPGLMAEEKKKNAKKRKTKRSRKKSSTLINQIKKHIRSEGGMAARVNTTGMYDASRGRWIKSGSDTVADIVAVKPAYTGPMGDPVYPYGAPVFIECKANAGDKLNERQIKHKDQVLAAGGYFIEARDFDQFKSEWEEI